LNRVVQAPLRILLQTRPQHPARLRRHRA
jgi:hypothetical protein